MDRNVEAVRERLLQRSERGLSKYGVTTERSDLSVAEWLQHLQDELLDAAVYIETLKHQATSRAAATSGICSGNK